MRTLFAFIAVATMAAQGQTMSISGRIVSAATGKPIPGATASSNCEGCDFTVGGKVDADGRFQITIGGVSRNRVWGSAPGYMTRAYGEEPEIGFTPVAVRAGASVSDIEIRLHRGGTITGTVTDEFNDPVVGATVRALARASSPSSGGEWRLIARASAQTDDRGIYRLIGLGAGEYVVGASEGLSVTLAPSATAVPAARRVTLGEDAELDGVNIQTRAVARGAIEGPVAGPGAGSPALAINLLPDPNPTSLPAVTVRAQGGRFQIADVPAGRYLLIVRPVSTGAPGASFLSSLPSWAREEVVVTAGATTRLALTLRGGARVSGRVESPEPLRNARISIGPIGDDHPEASAAQALLDADGSFTILNIAPGRYRWIPQQQLTRSGQRLQSAFVKDVDITDVPLDIKSDSLIENVRVMLTEPARIAGTSLDARGQPATTGAIVIAADDDKYWSPVSRRVRVVRPDTDGGFEVRVPPGRYHVTRVSQLAPGQLWEPAFLKTVGRGLAVTAEAGKITNVQLRLK